MENKIIALVLTVIFIIVGFVVIFYIIGALAPTLSTASTNITSSGLPLAGLFSNSGVLMIIFMVAVFVTLIILAFSMLRSKKY